ncbi:centromere protein S isoform X3 [Heterocephalus glaber]|uniref:Centromere protein S n=1 Tax=Heterocephalus glaber TaxID=10181 RepID=A0AAX6RQA4_HETGA|nr:centromere protein S isoform X2 [Heterocephalus glaber]XP_021099286.1 centromere protein S isoform X2 [Heterocephalus glaber]XP_021099287.1 centromere protein S isoform X3 [Heterocephalus glaber]
MRLKAAVHYTVGCLCQEVEADKEVQFSKQTIAAISEMTFQQCENFARDLEMFARHAKRSTINTEDVKLLARRSNSLSRLRALMPGLPTMDGAQARGTQQLLLLLLLLLWGATATALALEGGPASQDRVHMQEMAEIKKDSLLTLLTWWDEWTSQASTGDLVGGHSRKVAKRQEGAPLQQPPRRDKTRCKNFFWKTFSSCK